MVMNQLNESIENLITEIEQEDERYIIIETFKLNAPFILSDENNKPFIFKTQQEAEKAIYKYNCVHAIILDI